MGQEDPGGRHGNPLQYFCLKNPMDRGAWWASIHRTAKIHHYQSNFTHIRLYGSCYDMKLQVLAILLTLLSWRLFVSEMEILMLGLSTLQSCCEDGVQV